MNENPYCKICNKQYASKSSLCNHNKKYHPNLHKNPQNLHKIPQNTTINDSNNPLVCKHCSKQLSRIDSKKRHENNCKEKEKQEKQKEQQEEKEKRQIEKEERQRELQERREKQQIEKEDLKIELLKKKLQISDKEDTVTLQKLNNILLKRHNRINNSTVNSHNNIQNNIQNNNIQNITNHYQIISLGNENIPSLLTNQEKQMILDSRHSSLKKLITIIHCGKYDQLKNVIITNIKETQMYKYDETKGIFISGEREEILKDLIDFRLEDLTIIYNELLSQNKVEEKTKKCIDDFMNYMNSNDENNENKKYQFNEIKMLLYNNKYKITNDIYLMLTVN